MSDVNKYSQKDKEWIVATAVKLMAGTVAELGIDYAKEPSEWEIAILAARIGLKTFKDKGLI